MSLTRAQRGSVFALFVAVRVRAGHQSREGAGSRRRVCLYSSFTGGLIVRCDQLLARRSFWSQEALFFFILGRKRPEEAVEKLARPCVFFRINLLSRSSNRFKDERLLIIPPLFFLVNLTFLLFSFNPLEELVFQIFLTRLLGVRILLSKIMLHFYNKIQIIFLCKIHSKFNIIYIYIIFYVQYIGFFWKIYFLHRN